MVRTGGSVAVSALRVLALVVAVLFVSSPDVGVLGIRHRETSVLSGGSRSRTELLYPCYVCIRTLNAYVAQWHEMVHDTPRQVLVSPKWNQTGICQSVPTNLIRARDEGPCLRYENGICLKRFGRPGVIAPKKEGEGDLDNPFTKRFGERPKDVVVTANMTDSHGNAIPFAFGNDTWCHELVTELSAHKRVTDIFKKGCTVFPGLSYDDYWHLSDAERPKSSADMMPKYYREADEITGCRMRDACSCLLQPNQQPYCPLLPADTFDDPAYWSEPEDLFVRRRKSLGQRRNCVSVGDSNPPPAQPPLPPPMPKGFDAPKLVINKKTGKPEIVPTVFKPILVPGKLSMTALKKLAMKKSKDYLKKMKKKADDDDKKAADAGKKLIEDKKAGPAPGPITKEAPNV